jgi:hypothetical protein
MGSFVSVAQPIVPTEIASAAAPAQRVRFIMPPCGNPEVGRATNDALSAPCSQASSARRTNHPGFGQSTRRSPSQAP